MANLRLVALELHFGKFATPCVAGDLPVKNVSDAECDMIAFPAQVLWPMEDDPVSDRDPNRDRAPRPERKKLPWSFSPS